MPRVLGHIRITHRDPLHQQLTRPRLPHRDLPTRLHPLIEQKTTLLEIEVQIGASSHTPNLEHMFYG